MWKAIALMAAMPNVWFLFKLGTAHFVSPEKAGRLFLLLDVRKRGVDSSAIPNSAWDELVGHSITIAKSMAKLDKRSSNWRANLVSCLEIEASFVDSVLNGWGGEESETTRETLLKHGVNVPPSGSSKPPVQMRHHQ
jgi:hypothetical protein